MVEKPASPNWVELLPDETFFQRYLGLINEAKDEIYLTSYKFELTGTPYTKKVSDIFNALCEARRRGVVVEIVLNWNKRHTGTARLNTAAIAAMRRRGLTIRYTNNDRTGHAKILIVDGRHVIIGSHNLSARSMSYNFEMSVYIQDEHIANAAREVIEDTSRPV